MDLVIFEENKPLVLEALEDGELDYIDAASEVFETDFFEYINASPILSKLSETYPSPREKVEVPISLYIASDLSMRLHGVNAFNAYPMLVRVGGMLNMLGPAGGKKVIHPDTGDVSLKCEGYNSKNVYNRETPCDKDFLRKFAKDTDANALMQWYGHDVVRIFKDRRAFDEEGIFIGDASYLFVPDNPNYEGSVKLIFDEDDHPVKQAAYDQMTAEQKVRCQWRRCYKMVTLLHTNSTLDFFIFVGVTVMSGNAHESPVLYDMVSQFVQAAGKGVMKQLILDRGFIDGEAISTCKKKYGIDVLIPVRRNMDIYQDALSLFSLHTEWTEFEKPKKEQSTPPRPRPALIEKRERNRQETLRKRKREAPPPAPPPHKVLVQSEVAAIGGFESWSSCEVPLTVVATREVYADGHERMWFLLDTRETLDPCRSRQDYGLRTSIEERYRQLKGYSALMKFTSRAFSLVVNQVVFILLAYSLLQIYLLRKKRTDVTSKTPPSIRKQLVPTENHIIVYYQNYYGLFEHIEYTELMTVGLSDEARRKIGMKCRFLKQEKAQELMNPRPTNKYVEGKVRRELEQRGRRLRRKQAEDRRTVESSHAGDATQFEEHHESTTPLDETGSALQNTVTALLADARKVAKVNLRRAASGILSAFKLKTQ